MRKSIYSFKKIGYYRDQPGIYHSADLGLISLSSDGQNWITIADRNLGAVNIGDWGLCYQRGNNYGFPNTGAVTKLDAQVDTTGYGGPNNYYTSSTFLLGYGDRPDWSNPSNDNLWGAVVGTNQSMRGPCPEGYHIPTTAEFRAVLNYGYPIILKEGGGYLDGMTGEQALIDPIYYINFWTSNGDVQFRIHVDEDRVDEITNLLMRCNGCYIRPFANTPVIPTIEWEILYQPS